MRGLSPEDTESGRTRAEEIQDQRQRVLNIPLMGGEEGQGLLPGSLETWTSHRCLRLCSPLSLQLSMKGPPGPVGLTGRPGPMVSKEAAWKRRHIRGDDSNSNSL